MAPRDYEAEIAAFIRTKGITRCPTACAVRPRHRAARPTNAKPLDRKGFAR
jgi:hypothetical protein